MASVDRWDRFEARILRLCRGQYLGLASLGAVAVVGGAVMAVVGLVLQLSSGPSLPPDVAAAQSVTLSAVEQLRADHADLFDLEKATDRALTVPYRRDQEVPEAFKALFPNPPYVWLDVIEDKKIARVGVHRLISSLLGEMSDREARELLNGITPAIREAKVEKRSELLLAAGLAYLRADEDRQRALAERQQKVASIKEKHEAAGESRGLLIVVGVYGVVSGFSAMLLSGLFLAFLAVERHLRDIRSRQLG